MKGEGGQFIMRSQTRLDILLFKLQSTIFVIWILIWKIVHQNPIWNNDMLPVWLPRPSSHCRLITNLQEYWVLDILIYNQHSQCIMLHYTHRLWEERRGEVICEQKLYFNIFPSSSWMWGGLGSLVFLMLFVCKFHC